jgi:hypothetical protein
MLDAYTPVNDCTLIEIDNDFYFCNAATAPCSVDKFLSFFVVYCFCFVVVVVVVVDFGEPFLLLLLINF